MGIEQIDVVDEDAEKRALGNREELVREIASVLNRRCRENVSNTPDFILAEHMVQSLESFERTSRTREGWYGTSLVPAVGPEEALKRALEEGRASMSPELRARIERLKTVFESKGLRWNEDVAIDLAILHGEEALDDLERTVSQSTGQLTVAEIDDLIAEAGPGCEEVEKRLKRAQKGDRID